MKVAAITGAYGGLGAALSKALAKKGYKLVLGGRDGAALEKFAAEVRGLTDVAAVTMDVRSKSDCERLVDAAVEKFGRLDLLINNAGVWDLASFEETSEAQLREMFETNFFGPFFCSQAAVRLMKKQGSGHMLNIGSTAAVDYKTALIAYGTSKAALIALTNFLRGELKGTGIRVSVFSPGGIKTGVFRRHPEMLKSDYMEPSFVAGKIIEHIENPTDDWHVILKRPVA